MKRKKGFLSPSEESPPRHQPRQCCHRPQRPRAAHSAPARSDVYPRGMDLPAIPCIRRWLRAGRAAWLKEQGTSESPDTSRCICCGTTPATSGRKGGSPEMGMARNATQHQESSSPNWNESWLIYTKVLHLSCPPQSLLQSLGGCSLPRLLNQGDKPPCAVPVQTSQATCRAPRSRQRQRRERGKASEMPQLQVFYPQSQKKTPS